MIEGTQLTYVLDASVVLKWYVKDKEKYFENTLKIREDFRNRTIELIAPELLIYELVNVLRYKKELEDKVILNAVTSIYEMRIIKPVNQNIMEQAFLLARKYDITVYDSTYVSFAQYLNCKLITADEELSKKLIHHPHILLLNEY